MKSSEPLFTRQNPFPPASTVRRTPPSSNPSSKQASSKKERKTTLSPVRSSQRARTQLQPLSHKSQRPCKKPDCSFSNADGQPDFREIWPSTDSGSSPGSNTASPESRAYKQSVKSETSMVSPGVKEDSVLAKYIDRFRHGKPQSREERQQMASVIGEEQMSFWWTSRSAPSSTSTKTADNDVHDTATYSTADLCQHDKSLSVLSDSSQGEYDDTEIQILQERANRLLLRGECSLSDESVLVSSEGLGCSDFSFPVTVDEPVRQPLMPNLIKPTTENTRSDSVHAVSSQKYVIPTLAPSTRPEEDILFQWRLRRKMEQAREWPQSQQHSSLHGSALSWHPPSLTFPLANRQAIKPQTSTQSPQLSHQDAHPHITAPEPEATDATRLYPPPPRPSLFPDYVVSSSSLSQPQANTHVPAHMHLLCDVLPCPIQPPHAGGKQSVSQRLEESQTKVVHKKNRVPETSSDTNSMPSSPHTLSGTTVTEGPSRQQGPEKNKKKKGERKESEKNTLMSTRQQRKTTRDSSHQSLLKTATLWKEEQQQDGSQEFPRKSSAVDHEAPPSPIHTALGQVVSAVLFPTAESSSSAAQKVSSVSPLPPVSSPSNSTLPPRNAQNSLEVISELLREAEDSDEKEFEDDPLLQVLRQQRKWVKNQISEVDSVLNEFLEEQQVP